MANANTRKDFHRYYTQSEEKALFKLLKNTDHILAKRDLAWMQLLRATGIRIGILGGKILKNEDGRKRGKKEALTMDEAQENENVGRLIGLTVGEAKTALLTGYLTHRTDISKTKSNGNVHLTKNGRAALTQLLKIRRDMGYPENHDGQLILGQKNNGLSIRQFQERFSYWANQVGLKGSPHWMRHTVAKRMMADSVAKNPVAIVQSVLDHKNPSSTAVYTAPDKEDIAFAMSRVC